MLRRQKLALHGDAPGLPHTLIPRETLADFAQANQLLSRANAKADERLSLAQTQCDVLLEQAAGEFWQRADAQLKRWERDRQQMCDSLEQYATSVVTQAIRSLLDETIEPRRLAALIKQLLASQVAHVHATLLCHPHELDDVRQCLASHGVTLWKLQPQDTVKPQTLVLKTDEGDFRIDWRSMFEVFLNNPSQ
ncbi:type III secretion system stator protein SctL [Pseudomonas sp. Bout1]|uniref:type III secretion system stator protein SctL n=1 Tax=Pseudomonas sp. Bout1 TaxID=3048600 RepID=UPI002AB5033A|nr:type III secretion system stator protein SctL [Pseudomonas sp. Bout1]MDY7530921.1 type III secretion system stator protein SctL [Pseudomonas sp. Bout1]MEB0189004.1 type III secretion system stator protein SctL [Pseudomonas sp. Bout1]